MAPGDFMANAPLEFLLEGSNVTLDLLYVVPGQGQPTVIPEHDLAIVAVGESDDNRPVLREVAALIRSWPRPVLNAPGRIDRLSRDAACALLGSAAGTAIPLTTRIERAQLANLGCGATAIATFLPDAAFPIIARPIGSHAGDGLSKLDDAAAVAAYLEGRPEQEFYISPFVDYRGSDGFFRKYRIVLIDGRPYASHMAVSQHWMVHYLNAGMTESAAKRAEEARFMATFDSDFAVKHKAALRAVAERVGLEYFAIDCGETPDGRLLLFEADVAMIVHAMDPPDMFPYKAPQMRKVFDAFHAMLHDHARRKR
jgi:glutathione synthase/RimK-type ligase-like ATP-grasp enzyme